MLRAVSDERGTKEMVGPVGLDQAVWKRGVVVSGNSVYIWALVSACLFAAACYFVARAPGVELAGGAYHGIGIGDCLREGAAAAERALEHVRGLPEDAVPPQPADVPAGDGVAD